MMSQRKTLSFVGDLATSAAHHNLAQMETETVSKRKRTENLVELCSVI